MPADRRDERRLASAARGRLDRAAAALEAFDAETAKTIAAAQARIADLHARLIEQLADRATERLKLRQEFDAARVDLAAREREVGPLLLTPEEAALSLAMSERKLFALTKDGEIRSVRNGGSVRYRPEDLAAFADRLAAAGADVVAGGTQPEAA